MKLSFRIVLGLALACVMIDVAAAQSAPVVLQVWNRNGTLMGEDVKAFNATMSAEGKNIRAEFTLVPYEEQSSKFLTALAAGKAPDVYAIDDILGPYFANQGAWLDITDKVNSLAFKSDLLPGMLYLGEWKGRQYLVPWANDCAALIYNKRLLSDFGLQPPTTWREMLAAAKKITDSGKTYGITFSGANAGMTMFTWLPFAWMNGAELISKDAKKASFDSSKAVEALQFWVDLAKYAPKGAPSYEYADYYNGFTTGKVAMIFGGSWHVMSIANDAPDLDFGIVPFPVPKKGGKTSTFMGGDNIAIAAQSKNPEAAWEFVTFVLGEQVQSNIHAKNGSVPVRMSFANNTYFDKDPRYKVFAQVGAYGWAPKAINYNSITSIMSTIMPQVLSGSLTPAVALKKVNPQIQKVLD